MLKLVWKTVLTILVSGGTVASADSLLKVSVQDQSSQPAAAVGLQIMRGTDVVASSVTGETGTVAFPQLAPGHYSLTATKQGFEPVRGEFDIAESGTSTIELMLVPALARHDQIDVHDTVTPVEA